MNKDKTLLHKAEKIASIWSLQNENDSPNTLLQLSTNATREC